MGAPCMTLKERYVYMYIYVLCMHLENVLKAQLKQGGNKVATIKLVQPCNNLVESL